MIPKKQEETEGINNIYGRMEGTLRRGFSLNLPKRGDRTRLILPKTEVYPGCDRRRYTQGVTGVTGVTYPRWYTQGGVGCNIPTVVYPGWVGGI